MGEKTSLVPRGHSPARPWQRVQRVIDDNVKAAFLFALEEAGTDVAACDAAGVSVSGIKAHLNPESNLYDAEFAEAYAEAKQRWVETVLHAAAVSRAVDGWQEPIVGGKDRDIVVAHKPMFDSRLLEALLKRYDKEFRDKVPAMTGPALVNHVHKLDLAVMSPEDRALVRRLLAPSREAVDVEAVDVTPK